MDATPTVSVVIPLYNKARHIRRAVDSVLGQSLRDFELIVVDDGSTDGSGEVVRSVDDPRIRLIAQKNAGESVARNRGTSEARSDLVAFLDADDEWTPVFLDSVLGLHARYPEAGMFATAYRIQGVATNWRPPFRQCVDDPRGGLLEDYFRADLVYPHPVMPCAVMIRKPVLADVGGFPQGVAWGEDVITWVAIALRYRVAWSPVEGAVHHLDTDNRTPRSRRTTDEAATAPVIEAFLDSGQKPLPPRKSVELYLTRSRLALALERHIEGMSKPAGELMDKAGEFGRAPARRLAYRAALSLPPQTTRRLIGMGKRWAPVTRRVLLAGRRALGSPRTQPPASSRP